jgi:hypothetical protein
MEYDLFIYNSYRPFIKINEYANLLIYCKIKTNTNNDIINMLKNYLKNENIKINKFITSNFINFIYSNWKSIYKNNKLFIKYDNKYKQNGSGYHKISETSNVKYISNKIPIVIDDLENQTFYNIKSKDLPPLCHWGQKKLLLSEIQFLTNIKMNGLKDFKDYAIVYIGSACGSHLPILFNMFPDLIWLLDDPNPYSEYVKRFGKDKVSIFNMYFTDDTIEHVFQNVKGRKILFISDIRVTPTEEQVMSDMAKQAEWGIKLHSDYMLLKFRLPYNAPNAYKPKTINDLNLNKKYISNYYFVANHSIYLKGDLYLQLYPPPYSTELRLLVKKNNEGKYDLDNYDNETIENKLFNYNSEIRGFIDIEGYNFLNVIVGFDTSLECIMEYNIIKKYYEYFENIKDNNIILQKIYDINILLEKFTKRPFITCNYISTIKKNNNNKQRELSLIYNNWEKIINLNIKLQSKFQEEYIKKYGNNILGKERTRDSLKYLKKYLNNSLNNYFELIV